MSTTLQTRPPLIEHLPAAEFRRWYWLRAELATFARSRGLPAAGAKAELTERIAASLAGSDPPAPTVSRRRRPGPLPEPLTAGTRLPPGQPCSEQVRRWLLGAIGPGFRFDTAMREFFAGADGSRTLGEAVSHWYGTRGRPPRPIGPQFELNRFIRQWHLDHPHGSRAELLRAWGRYRARPVDRRDRA